MTSTMDKILQLDIWKGDWGLPSIDVNCLNILACVKFNGIPVRIRTTNNPFKSPNGQLPVFKSNNETFCEVDQIINYLRKQKCDLDSSLSQQQISESIAYKSMLDECLRPVIYFTWWLDERNANELIYPWFTKATPFPFNFYYPGKFKKEAKDKIAALYNEKNLQSIENIIENNAKKCITALSIRLGDSEYFNGNTPTTLDAAVFSYLAPILKTPLPRSLLQNHLKACNNLVKFLNQILRKYFGDDFKEYEDLKAKQSEKKATQDFDRDFPHKRRDQILAGVFATVAMAGYALSTGIVQVQDDRDNEDSIKYDFEEGEE